MMQGLLRIFLLSATIPLSAGMVFADGHDDADAAFKKGDYATFPEISHLMADRGEVGPHIRLGVMYDANGFDTATGFRDQLEARMTARQIADATRRAWVCADSNYADCA